MRRSRPALSKAHAFANIEKTVESYRNWLVTVYDKLPPAEKDEAQRQAAATALSLISDYVRATQFIGDRGRHRRPLHLPQDSRRRDLTGATPRPRNGRTHEGGRIAPAPRHTSPPHQHRENLVMTAKEAKQLKPGDIVVWAGNYGDQGIVKEVAEHMITFEWRNTQTLSHLDPQDCLFVSRA